MHVTKEKPLLGMLVAIAFAFIIIYKVLALVVIFYVTKLWAFFVVAARLGIPMAWACLSDCK